MRHIPAAAVLVAFLAACSSKSNPTSGPQGDIGLRGDPGDPGVAGPQGPAGPAGAAGPAGGPLVTVQDANGQSLGPAYSISTESVLLLEQVGGLQVLVPRTYDGSVLEAIDIDYSFANCQGAGFVEWTRSTGIVFQNSGNLYSSGGIYQNRYVQSIQHADGTCTCITHTDGSCLKAQEFKTVSGALAAPLGPATKLAGPLTLSTSAGPLGPPPAGGNL